MTLLHSITHRSVAGMASQGISLSLIQRIGGIALSLILVRILAKEEFGAYGVASTALTWLMTFSGQQFAERSFFTKEGEDPRYDRHLGFTIILHAFLTLIVLALAVAALQLDVYKPAAPLLFFGALGPMLNAPRVIYITSLKRDLDWKRIRTLGLIAFIFVTATTLSLALAGFGAIALMCQIVLVPVPTLIDMVWKRPDLLRPSFNFRGYREALHFGAFRSGGAALDQGRLFFESLFIGGVLGLTTLGLYGRAFGISQLTSGWLSGQMSGIAYPLLSKIQPATKAYRRAAGLLVRFCLWTAAPPAVAVGLSADAAVAVLYGETWLEAIPYVRPLLITVISATFVAAMNVVALGAVGPRFVFLNQMMMFLVTLVGLTIALPMSLVAYAWTLAVGFVLAAAGVVFRLWRARGIDLTDFMKACLPSLVLVALAVTLEKSFFWSRVSTLPHWAVLAISATCSTLIMCVLIRLLDADGLRRAMRFAPQWAQAIAAKLLLLSSTDVKPKEDVAL